VGGALPQALASEAQRVSRGRGRGGVLFRLGCGGEVDRQHFERRCRECAELYKVTGTVWRRLRCQHPFAARDGGSLLAIREAGRCRAREKARRRRMREEKCPSM